MSLYAKVPSYPCALSTGCGPLLLAAHHLTPSLLLPAFPKWCGSEATLSSAGHQGPCQRFQKLRSPISQVGSERRLPEAAVRGREDTHSDGSWCLAGVDVLRDEAAVFLAVERDQLYVEPLIVGSENSVSRRRELKTRPRPAEVL